MEDCGEYSLRVWPRQVKRIEEVYQSYTYFAENDLLIAKITPCFENGKMSIAKNLVNSIGFGSTEFIVLRAKERVLIEWVYYWLRNADFLKDGKSIMTGSAGQQRINVDFVGDYPIPFPPLAAQQELINELKQDEKDKERQRKFIKHQVNKRERILRDVW